MANKKRAGLKMKKSPNKSRFAAGTDPEYIRQFNQSLYGPQHAAEQAANQTYGSYMGVPVKGNPVRPRGLFGGGGGGSWLRRLARGGGSNQRRQSSLLDAWRRQTDFGNPRLNQIAFGRGGRPQRGGGGDWLAAGREHSGGRPSAFTMKRGSKPNKSEFFKGKK